MTPDTFQSVPSGPYQVDDFLSKDDSASEPLHDNDTTKEPTGSTGNEPDSISLHLDTLNSNISATEHGSESIQTSAPRDSFRRREPNNYPSTNHLSVSVSDPDKEESSSSMKPSTIQVAGINGGDVYRIPATWNRLHVPWFRPESTKLLTPEESNHRYLYSASRIGTSDGIGHSMGVVNRDFNFAISLNLTYTHRVGTYSSLTTDDRFAVEEFFGWGVGEIPRTDIQREGCIPQKDDWPGLEQISVCHICESPRPDGALKIKHLVDIPADLRSNCLNAQDPCQSMKSKFLSAHQESHTVFQASRQTCSPPATDGNFLVSKSLFFHKYWNKHGQRPWKPQNAQPANTTRPIRYKQEELNIAVHIRRGDFLDPETQAKRGITKDGTFAQVLVNALSVVQNVGGPFSKMPIVVHIYSEGKLTENQVTSIHLIDTQDKMYYDSNGTARDEHWWANLIAQTVPSLERSRFMSLRERLKVVLHISEDTLLCLHEMVSADIFIGSKSGLSNALVWSLSRGVVLIPHASTINVERGKKGEICCSVPFSNKNGLFDSRLFKLYWTTYVQANDASVLHTRSARNLLDRHMSQA